MRTLTTALCTYLSLLSFSVSADTDRPTVVANVVASSGPNSSIVVSWSGANDNVGVDGYNLYRNGDYYKTVFNTRTYTDNNVSLGRDYRYTVVAFDLARNYSVQSASATASIRESQSNAGDNTDSTLVASGRPTAPDSLRVEIRSPSSAHISWNAPTGGADGYNIYRDNRYYMTVKGRTEYTANALNSDQNYSFYVVAFRNSLYSSKSARISVRTGSAVNSNTLVEGTPESGQPAVDNVVVSQAPAGSQVSVVQETNQLPNIAPEIAGTSHQCDPVAEMVAYRPGDTNYFTLSVDDESPLTLTYDADSSNDAVASVSVDDNGVFQVTALSRGESLLWLFAEDDNGLADEFELRVVVD